MTGFQWSSFRVARSKLKDKAQDDEKLKELFEDESIKELFESDVVKKDDTSKG